MFVVKLSQWHSAHSSNKAHGIQYTVHFPSCLITRSARPRREESDANSSVSVGRIRILNRLSYLVDRSKDARTLDSLAHGWVMAPTEPEVVPKVNRIDFGSHGQPDTGVAEPMLRVWRSPSRSTDGLGVEMIKSGLKRGGALHRTKCRLRR